jgi:micrococcal nuclease
MACLLALTRLKAGSSRLDVCRPALDLMPFQPYFYQPIRPPRQQLRRLFAIELIVFTALAMLLLGYHDMAVARALVRSGVVTRVVDGDTVWVKAETRAVSARGTPDGEILKVRLLGIDAPEICQLGGLEARDVLRGHVLGQTVTLTSPSSRSHDDYGRLLANLDKQGEDVGRWMVRRGQAWSYSYRRNPGPYGVEQAQAQAAGAGLFAQGSAENPRSFRKRHGSCHP